MKSQRNEKKKKLLSPLLSAITACVLTLCLSFATGFSFIGNKTTIASAASGTTNADASLAAGSTDIAESSNFYSQEKVIAGIFAVESVDKIQRELADNVNASGGSTISGDFKVTKNTTVTASTAGTSGIIISNTVRLYIASGVTLTVKGGDASGTTGAGAGINLPSDATLELYGSGTVNATGGNAAAGTDGTSAGSNSYHGNSYYNDGQNGYISHGGAGGAGGGGAGAGIGGAGGNGGEATGYYNGYYFAGNAKKDGKSVRSMATVTSGGDWNTSTNSSYGSSGASGGAMGTLNVYNAVSVIANGGSKNSTSTSGGTYGGNYAGTVFQASRDKNDYVDRGQTGSTGAGGGGGSGGAGAPIGGGGGGGGSGHCGEKAAFQLYNDVFSEGSGTYRNDSIDIITGLRGAGGGGGGGYNGNNGGTGGTGATAQRKIWWAVSGKGSQDISASTENINNSYSISTGGKTRTITYSDGVSSQYSGGALGGGGTVNNYSSGSSISGTQNTVNNHRLNVILDPIAYAKDVLKASTTFNVSSKTTVLRGVTDGNTLTFAASGTESNSTLSTMTSAIDKANSNGVSTDDFYVTSTEYTSGSLMTMGLASYYAKPDLPGYDFTGYYTSTAEDAEMVIDANMNINPNFYVNKAALGCSPSVSGTLVNGMYKLYAHYTPKTYTVNFNVNGGTTTPSGSYPSKTYTFDGGYTIPNNVSDGVTLTKNGYKFDGWSDNDYVDYTVANGFDVKYKLDDNGKGTSIEPGAGTDKLANSYNMNMPRGEYKASATVYAAWKKTLTVDAEEYNGTNFVADGITVYYNTQLPSLEKLYSAAPMQSFRGISTITFDGIYTDKNGKGNNVWDKVGKVASAATKWTYETDTVYFKWVGSFNLDRNTANGNTPSKPSTSITGWTSVNNQKFVLGQGYDKGSTNFPSAKRVGYKLLGYTFDKTYTDASKAVLFLDENGTFKTGAETSQTGAIENNNDGYRTLYAVWEPVEYTVKLMANFEVTFSSGNASVTEMFNKGSANPVQEVKVKFDERFPVLTEEQLPTLEGFEFEGFSISKTNRIFYIDGDGTPSADRWLDSDFLDSNGGAKNLYGQWKQILYTANVAVVVNDGGYISDLPVSLVRRSSYKTTDGVIQDQSKWVKYTMSPRVDKPYTAQVPRGEYVLMIDGYVYEDTFTDLEVYNEDLTVDSSTPYIFNKIEFRVTGDNTITFAVNLRSNTTYKNQRQFRSNVSYWLFHNEEATLEQITPASELKTSSLQKVWTSIGLGVEDEKLTEDLNWRTSMIGTDPSTPVVGGTCTITAAHWVIKLDCRSIISDIGFTLATPVGGDVVGDYVFQSTRSNVGASSDKLPVWSNVGTGAGISAAAYFENGVQYRVTFYIRALGLSEFAPVDNITVTIYNGQKETQYKKDASGATKSFLFISASESGYGYNMIEVTYTFDKTAAVLNAWATDGNPKADGGVYDWVASPVTVSAKALYGNVNVLFGKVGIASESDDPLSDKDKNNWSSNYPMDAGDYYVFFYVVETDAYTGLTSGKLRIVISKYNIVIGETDGGRVTYNGKNQSSTLAKTKYGDLPEGVITITNATNVKDAGTYDVSITLNKTNNYTLNSSNETEVTTHFVIEKANLVISMIDFTETYGYELSEASLTSNNVRVEGLVNDELLSTALQLSNGAALQNFTFKTAYDTGILGKRSVGTYDIEIVENFLSKNYNYQLNPGTFEITKKTIYVSTPNVTMEYGDEIEFEYTIDIEGDNGRLLFDDTRYSIFGSNEVIQAVNFDSGNVKCGTYRLQLNPSLNARVTNYEVVLLSSSSFTLNRHKLLITANDIHITYGDKISASDYGYTVSGVDGAQGLVHGDSFDDLIVRYSTNKLKNMISVSSNYNTTSTSLRGAGTQTIYISGPEETENYTVTYVNGTLEVAKAMLTVKVDDKDIYYGTATPNAYEYTVTGWKYTSDNESVIDTSDRVYDCNYDSSDPNNRSVGNYYVHVSGLDADNYEFTYERGVLNVKRLPLTLVPTFVDLTYGDKTLSYVFKFTGNDIPYAVDEKGLIEGVQFSWKGDSVVSLDLLNVGNYPVTFGRNLSQYADNYEITTPTNIEIKIVKRGAVITVNNASTIYGTANDELNEFTFTTTNMLERDAASLRSMLANDGALLTGYNSANAGLRHAGEYNIYVDQNYVLESITMNYDLTYVDGTLTVNKKMIVIGMDNVEIIYGEEFDPESVTLKLVDSEWEFNDNFENFGLAIIKTASKFNGTDKLYDYDLSNFEHRQGGTYTVVLSVNADHENYELAFANGMLTVSPRKVNVVVQDYEITYGDIFDKNNLEYTFSAVSGDSKSGLVSGDLDWLKDYVTIKVDYDSTIYSKRIVGDYEFQVIAKANDNYDINVAENSGKLEVVKRGIVVKADAKSTVYGNAAPAFTVTYNGKLGDNDATYLNPAISYICEYRKLVNGSYTNVDAGKYEIRIEKITGDRAANYEFEFESDYLTVEKKNLYLEINDETIVYGSKRRMAQSDFSIKSWLGLQYKDEAILDDLLKGKIRYSTDYDLDNRAKRNVGTYDIKAEMIEELTNYNVTFIGNNSDGTGSILTVTKKPLTITAEDKQITYGQKAVYGFEFDGLITEDNDLKHSVSESCIYRNIAENENRKAGTYTINVVIDDDEFSNYLVTRVSGTLTVDKKVLTVTAQDQTLIYGQNLLPISVVYAGWEYGEDKTELTGSLDYDTNYDQLVASKRGVGVYEIEPKGLDAENYQIQYVKGRVTVNPKPLTITADDLEITYGASVPTDLFKLRNNKAGDFEYGETVADLFGTVNYSTDYNTTLVSTRGVGTYYVRPSGLTSENYELEFEDGVLTVIKKKLDIEVQRNTITYGDKVEHTVKYSGFEFDDNWKLLEGKLNFVTKYNPDELESRAVGEYNVRAEGYNSANYTIVYYDATLTVVKKDLTITTDPYTITWGDKVPVYKPVYGNFAFDEDETYLEGTLNIECGYNRYDNRGDYAITLSGLSSKNYNVIFVDGNLHVNPLTVSAPTIASMSYTGATLVPEVPTSDYYFVKTNDGGINVGRYFVVLSLENYPNVVWAGDESSADKEVYYEIVKTYYVVSFEQVGGNYVKGDLTQKVLMGDFVVEANIPSFVRTGFTFGGWFTDKAFTTKFDVTTPINADTVLYGYWVKNENALAGRVVNPDEEGLAQVTVTVIKNGKVLFTALTNDEGYFSTDGIVAGLYNFAIAYSAGDVDRAAAFAIDVTGDYDEMIKVVVDPQNVNTRVVVDSENIDFVADDLTNAFTKADLENVKVGGSVEFLVEIVENKFDKVNDFSNAAGLDRKDVNGYFTIKASKQVTDAQGKVTSSEVTETAGLVKYVVKLDDNTVGKSGYVLYRALKDGNFEVIGEKANDNGEYVKLSDDGKSLELYVLETGDYAIGYDTANLSVMDWAHIAGAAGVLTIVMLVAWIVVARRRRNG